MSPFSLSPWLPFVGQLLRYAAQAVIEGSRAAGVNHETVALTIAKTVIALTGGNASGTPGTPSAPPVVKPQP